MYKEEPGTRLIVATGLAAVALYLLPWLIMGQEAPCRLHDCLDSNPVWWKTLVESGKLFAGGDEIVPGLLGGLPRSVFGAELKVAIGLTALLPPFAVYIILQGLLRLLAFAGMYLLLSRRVIPLPPEEAGGGMMPSQPWVALGVSTLFSWLPFWLPGTGSVAGLPLVLWAFLEIRSGTASWKAWLIPALFPFFSSLIFSGIFVLLGLGMLWLVDWIRERRPAWSGLVMLVLLAAVYTLVNYRLLLAVGQTAFGSHRSEMVSAANSFGAAASAAVRMVLFGQLHTETVHLFLLLPLAALGLVRAGMIGQPVRRPLVLLVLLALIALQTSFTPWLFGSVLAPLVDRIPMLKALQLNRFYTFNPLLWYLVMAMSLRLLLTPGDTPNPKRMKRLTSAAAGAIAMLGILLLLQRSHTPTVMGRWSIKLLLLAGACILTAAGLGFLALAERGQALLRSLSGRYDGFIARRSGAALVFLLIIQTGLLFGRHEVITWRHSPGFEAFYAQAQFSLIQATIEVDGGAARVASLGLDPAVPRFNGFETVDGYFYSYPLEYKRRFRKVIAPELDRSDELRSYFDNWGSRCYLFSSELGKDWMRTKDRDTAVKDLHIDVEALSVLGADYLLSAVTIENAAALGLHLVDVFEHQDSAWRIRLYRLPTH